jgi:flagellar assembly protein FliH
MPLIKKEYIHEGSEIRHIGLAGSTGAGETAQQSYDPGITEEEQAQSILQQAEAALKKARQDAENIKQQAYQDIENARVQAKKEGFESGRQESLKQLRQNLQEVNKIIQQAKNEKIKIVRSAEPEILKLAVKVARVVIKKELEIDQTIVMKILEEAITKISDNQQVVIRVSHQDLQTVRNNKDKIIDLVEAKNLSIVADKHIEDGGCMIETKLGYIDASIETKLELIEKAMIDVYEEDRVKKEAAEKEAQEQADAGEVGGDIPSPNGLLTAEQDTAPQDDTEVQDTAPQNFETQNFSPEANDFASENEGAAQDELQDMDDFEDELQNEDGSDGEQFPGKGF